MKVKFYYLVELQYLGFRYHGWQIQPDVITVQKQVIKTLKWVLTKDNPCKVLASGRTDAMVSVNHTYIEIFTEKEIENLEEFLVDFNHNLPADIRALSAVPTDRNFNIIQSAKLKEYHYYFAFGEKFHPYAAALMCNIHESLDIALMKKAATQFEGKKDFYSYTFRPTPTTQTVMEIKSCKIEKNTDFTASFFPKESYVLKIIGEGFKRNQIRLMMGMLIEIGRKERNWNDFMATLNGENKIKLSFIAPASGLQLHRVEIV